MADAMAGDFGGAQFSTDSLPIGERLPFWREVFGRTIARIDFEPIGDLPFRQTVNMRMLDGLGVMYGETTGLMGRRTKELISDGGDDFVFTISLAGTGLASHGQREVKLEAGHAVLQSAAEAGALCWPGAARLVALRIPRVTLSDLVARTDDALLRPVARNAEALRLLVDYIAMTSDRYEFATPQLGRLFTTHVLDLVALAIGTSRDGAEVARGRGVRAARLRALKTDIAANLAGEGRLSLDALAGRHNISPVYIRKLFEGEGVSFTQFVLDQRLARAYRMLCDPNSSGRTIGSIALEVGFNDVSYFNRAFRRRYGASPSDVRSG